MKFTLMLAIFLMLLGGCTAKDLNENMSKIGDGVGEIVDTGKNAVNEGG